MAREKKGELAEMRTRAREEARLARETVRSSRLDCEAVQAAAAELRSELRAASTHPVHSRQDGGEAMQEVVRELRVALRKSERELRAVTARAGQAARRRRGRLLYG